MEIEEDVKLQSGEDDEAAAEGDSFDSLHLQHAAGEEDEDSSDSSWVAYEYHQTSNRCKTLWGRLCSGAPTLALARGTELQTRLSSEHPSFILQLQESHVTKKFFLDVPVEFCKLHLPAHNVEVTLEDEKGESYSVNFHPGTVQNLIIGWKKFAVAHKLLEDDVIVFHLLKPCFFKVYIIVANEPIIVACANRTGIDVRANEGNKGRNSEATDEEIPDLDTVQQGVKRSSSLSSPNIEPGQDHSSTDEFHTSDMMETFPLSNCDADSEGHKRLGNVGVLAREEKGDLSNSSGMVILYIMVANEPIIVACANRTGIDVHANEGNKGRNSEATDEEIPDLDTVQQGVKRSSSLSSPNIEPGQDHSSTDEFHTSDMMETFPLSNCDADSEGHKRLGNVGVLAREEKGDLSNSSGMVILKPPSVENHVAVCNKRPLRLHRKKSYKQVGYENQQTIMRWLTKTQRMDFEACALALERAKELRTNLSSEHPSFIKQMHPSSVNGKALLVVPMKFCRLHLPNHDAKVTLEDENGQSYIVKFVPKAHKAGFSTGWKRFSNAHKLLASNTVVFQLLRPCYFKVYIIRVSDLTGSTDLTNSNVNANKGKDAQGCVKRCSMLSNHSLEPGLDHSIRDEFRLSEMEASPSSKCDTDNLEVRAREVNEKVLPASSCMATRRRTMNGAANQSSSQPEQSSTCQGQSSSQPGQSAKRDGYENQQTIKRWLTKRQRKDSEACALTLERAKELQTNLSSEHPSFIKQICPSCVNRNARLAVPMEFCRLHLPNHDAEVTLEDENGEIYIVKFVPTYIIHIDKFIAGWKSFADAHKLLASDAVVFQLLRPCYFKIAYDYHQTSKRCKTLWGRLCSGAPTLALTRGTELQTSLSSEHPSFTLQMQESHVTKKFVLDVPAEFCKLHLPTHNVEVTLEDENGDSYNVNFQPGTVQNLITGWKRFAVAHKLLEDDVIVCHLLRPCLFKVYIIRANEPTTVGSANPTNNNVHANEGNKERNSEANDKEVCALAPNLDTVKEGVRRVSLLSNPNLEPGQDRSSTDEFHSSDMMEAFPLSQCDADSEGHKRQDNVGVLVREEKEEDLSNTSGMVTLKPPSVENNVAVCSKRVLRLSRKKTYKQLDYENQQMVKCFPTKRGSKDSEPCAFALETAKELQRNLSSEHPSFTKKMHRFNVIEGVLILPLEFCRLHLPNHDAEVTLEDENGEIYKVNFRPKSGMRFCGGWMRFSAAHNLAEGDVLVFHLLRPCCLKVYVVRVSSLIGSTDLTNSNVNANIGMKRKCEAGDRKGPRLAPHLDTDQGSVKRCSLLSNPSLEHGLDHSSRDEFHSSDMEASSSSKHDADNLEVQAREEKEKDSPDSSCMVTSKPPSVENNIPVSNKGVSRISRNKTNKKVSCANPQTIKRWLTKRRRMDSETVLVLERAKELQTNLSSEHPSFIKQMHLSDVTIKRTMLAIPLEFYKLHLPNHDAEVTLEDEHGESYIMKVSPTYRPRFIGGWKRFLDAHKLLASDIVVFHLLRPCYFKVYIMRVSDLNTDLTNSNVNANKGKKKRKCKVADSKGPGLAPHLDTDQGIVKRCSLLSSPSLEPGLDHLSRDENEKDLLASSCVVTSKPPSVEDNIPVSSKGISKLSRKKTHKKAAYVNQQTIKSWLTKRRRMDSEACALAERAKELQTNLPSEHPSFIKQMHPSNVIGKPVLAVPTEFYRLHLPNHDAEVTLEDENGESYFVKFTTNERPRFIGGWKRFTDAHKLLASDIVVFHLLRPCFFKVYIIRANDPTVVGSTNLTSSNVNSNKGKKKIKCEAADRKIPHLDTDQGSLKKCSLLSSNPSLEPGLLDHSSTKKSPSSSDIEACTFSGDFENFKIVVNGEIVDDQELPRSIRFKYYELCCSQKSFLHHKLLKNVNPALAAGIITGTLKVAEAIRSCKLSTSKDDFAMWDSTLEGFKNLGMEVGFLLQRLKRLAGFESEFRESEKFKRYVEVKKKQDGIRKEMRRIKRKFLELKRTTKKLEDEAKDEMKVDIRKCMQSFQKKASAPW